MLSWNVRLTYERYQQEDIIAARFVEKLIEQNSVEEKDLFPGAFFYAFLQWLCWQYVAGNRPAFFIFANFENKGGKIMAKPYKIPDFRKMYPEASEAVISVLRTSERKMQYQEYDL